MSDWRPAKASIKLRDQIDAKYPGRDKSNDGIIGDAAHQATTSDHNPNADGVVLAIDITHDPAHGLDAGSLAETLRVSHDPRIKYLISNNRIVSSVIQPWVWRPYTGSNPHTEHMHLSLVSDPALYDDTKDWQLRDTIVPQRQDNIIATISGGSADRQFSAYDGHLITDSELGVALPFKFQGLRPQVRVIGPRGEAVGDIVDVGPWNTQDPYWETGRRPQAESGLDISGRRTNRAGIDLTPAMARAVGIDGKGIVDWEFAIQGHDIRWMQGKLGVENDGIIGPLTIAAMIRHLEGET